jgi:hypothetical protein
MPRATAAIRVFPASLAELRRIQTALGIRTLDETIRTLMAAKRKDLIQQLYGRVRGISAFVELDRFDTDDDTQA